jgi:16S rRNA processing protein RimM
MVVVGRVARTHGHRGHVIVNPETDFPESRFAAGQVVFVREGQQIEARTITSFRMHQGRPIVGFEGVLTMTAAEALAGTELRVPESALTALPEGTYYEHDLVGCEVVTLAGASVGRVIEVARGSGAARLIVGAGGGEIQIPLVEAICVSIDVPQKRIVIDPPPGLLELNA